MQNPFFFRLETSVHCEKLNENYTSRSCSDVLPEKQLFLILLIATSVPLHFPWYTVPNVPDPNSCSSSRSAFLIVWYQQMKHSVKLTPNILSFAKKSRKVARRRRKNDRNMRREWILEYRVVTFRLQVGFGKSEFAFTYHDQWKPYVVKKTKKIFLKYVIIIFSLQDYFLSKTRQICVQRQYLKGA